MGGATATISGSLKQIFERDFETGMGELVKTEGWKTSGVLRDMAVFFSRFEAGINNFYAQLIRAVLTTGTQAVFSTLNYDTLLEQSISHVGLRTTYTGRLPAPVNNLLVLKPHGSCNWVPTLRPGGITVRNISFDLGPGRAIIDGEVTAYSDPQEVRDFCERENSFAPVMALYALGKKFWYCPSFCEAVIANWRAELKKASRVIIIGVRVNPADSHIWGPLATAPAKRGFYYVGPSPKDFNTWCENARRGDGSHLANTFEESIPLVQELLTRSF